QWDYFLNLLKRHDVTAIADVRSKPYSRIAPQFNREILEKSLNGAGIKYVFLGTELGARPADPSCYENGRVEYERLARTPLFQTGIDRVSKGSGLFRLAFMCSEREPLSCHRAIPVARMLTYVDFNVHHIPAVGHIEPHETA